MEHERNDPNMAKEPQERRRYVDMWAVPGMHPSNVEFLQKLKTADTNHFTTHMDAVGTVSELNNESGKWETGIADINKLKVPK